jgi:cytoskeletal protein RodZ
VTKKAETATPPDAETSSFGSLLKIRRETRGIPLDEASTRTRIRRNFLEALEEDRFADLPGETYICGFLRNYAEYLGLDPDETIASYQSRFKRSPHPKLARSGDQSQGKPWEAMPRWGLLVAGLLLLAALFFLGRLAIQSFRSESTVPSDLPARSSEPAGEGVSAEPETTEPEAGEPARPADLE